MLPLITPRLNLRLLDDQDAPFILELVNDPDWLRFIGDRGITSLDAARDFIHQGPLTLYKKHGFCMLRVGLKDSDQAVGLCGLMQRDNLPHPDLGFAFLPAGRGAGLATEAAQAVVNQADEEGRPELMAFCQPDNQGSINLLKRLGFVFIGDYRQKPDEQVLHLYRRERPQPARKQE
ncbi:GNAT family N-acetyltransferase [Lacimicrobium sp. SS2-24]|uniref:GNAT family N-acetyltransferase n=1 Tax=Lacimicrobium sp. SS2-24 TaxID=2005569 RepID=UPI000B4BC7F5|nr:GNAT family N-acetyltransferase [Lacimicrobium sp. SS2-24]